MFDQWVEEVDRGRMVGVVLTDLSSAYDMIPFPTMIQKLQCFGFQQEFIYWMQSFLQGRQQSTYIDGNLSPPLALEQGLPQGSILSPLLYILYTADVPDLVHSHPVTIGTRVNCTDKCGSTVAYTDDCTYSVGCDTPAELRRIY